MLEFGLLGEVTASVAGQPVAVGPARQRLVLAGLIVDANRVVSVDQLVARVWGVDPPQRARAVLNSYVSRLRQALGSSALAWRSGGYVLAVDRSAVDVHRFHDLRDRARATSDAAAAATLLAEALGLWRGPALTGLDSQWALTERDRLHQQRLAAEHDLTDALLRAGHGDDLVAELSARAAEYPLDERVAGQYLLALYRAGRAADALEHYRQIRSRLADELGTDPGQGLQDLHQRILNADPALTAPTRPATATTTEPSAERGVPRQLPAPPAPFTGRHSELAELTALLDEAGRQRTEAGHHQTIVISALAGAGGIGKTWLALHWAHAHADRFPDGQLFVDLRGFTPNSDPLDALTAVRGFLDALGVDPARIPTDLESQVALYRSMVAGRRMLMVLDNARTADQVIPLLPGTSTCTVLATSRRTLTALLHRHGAHHLPLDVLAEDDTYALLALRLGAQRLAAEPGAVAELIRLCGRYPLAVAIVAGRAQARPRIPLAEFAAELRDSGLAALADDDPAASLPAVLSWSVRALTAEQRRVFALLGMAPGPDIGLPAAASLADLPVARMRIVLRELEESSLVDRQPGDRYSMHDLIRAYAVTTAQPDLEALRRLIDFYAYTAYTADRIVDPHRVPMHVDRPVPGDHPLAIPDVPAAMAWFDAELANLLAARQAAISRSWHLAVWQLGWLANTFLTRRGHAHIQVTVWRAALDAAAYLPDPTFLRIGAYRLLGAAHADLGHHDEGIEGLHHALDLAEEHEHIDQQAETHRGLAFAWAQRGDFRQTLAHATSARDLYHKLDRPVGEADTLNSMGWATAQLGDYDTALAHCLAALALHRRLHNPQGEGTTLDSLGYIAHHSGDYQQAVDYYEQALAVFRAIDNTSEAAASLDGAGRAYVAIGEHERARAVWSELLNWYRQEGRDESAERVQEQLDTLDH